jgi:hypothetical protein
MIGISSLGDRGAVRATFAKATDGSVTEAAFKDSGRLTITFGTINLDSTEP